MELDTNRMLANAKEKDDFISCMSHEIRTPLNAIVGISELLANMRQTLTQEEIAYFEREISKNNVLLMKMIEDMLTVTLIDNSGITVQFEDLRYSDCTPEVATMREEESLNLFGLKIEVIETGEDVPIRADRNLLRRIMINLFDNAAKFSPMGSTVTVIRTVTDDEVILSVKDQGIGIDPQYHNMIFTRFYKIDHFSQGAGLGLALCKELAECMGARITVESELGKGTTFLVTLKSKTRGKNLHMF
jgi:signal transduction histidine kinase